MTTQGHDEALPDHQLVIAAQAGDRDAFDALVARYRPRIEGFLRRKDGDAVLAADLAQDTFDDAYAGLAHLREPRAFKAWLYSIASAQMLREQRWRQRQAALAQMPPRSSASATARTRRQVQRAMGRLSDTLRGVLLLHDVEGYSIREIAAILGISEDTAQKRLWRARTAFRKQYANEDDDDMDGETPRP